MSTSRLSTTLKPRSLYVYNNTLFKSNGIVSGCSTEVRTTTPHDNEALLRYLYRDESGLITFHALIETSITIYKERLYWESDTNSGVVEDTVELVPYEDKIDISFDLLFKDAGHYKLYFEFTSITGVSYSKILEVDVTDNHRPILTLYKMESMDQSELLQVRHLKDVESDDLAFALSSWSTPSAGRYNILSQMICGARSSLKKNHTLIIPANYGKLYITSRDVVDLFIESQTKPVEQIIDELRRTLGLNYFVYHMKRSRSRALTNPVDMILLIDKRFDNKQPIKYIGDRTDHPYVDEMRFYPIFHRLHPLDDYIVHPEDTIYVESSIKHTRDSKWTFKNATTLESVSYSPLSVRDVPSGKYGGDWGVPVAGSLTTPLVNPSVLKKGYYDISLKYTIDSEEQEYVLKSAFLVE